MPHHVYHAPGGGEIHAITTERDPNYEQALRESGTLFRVTTLEDDVLPSTLTFYHHLDPKNPDHVPTLALQHLSPPNLHLHYMNGGTIVPKGTAAQIGGAISGQVATRAEVDALRKAIADLTKLITQGKSAPATPPPPPAPMPAPEGGA